MIPVIGPILGMVAGFESGDAVLRCFNLLGLAGFKLSQAENFSHTTRKRAYIRQAETMIAAMTEADQWRFAVAAARFLREHDESGEIVAKRLASLGWKFDGERFSPIKQPEHAQPVFFPAGDTYDAYVHVRDILQTAKGELFIVDPYAGPRTYALLATVKDLQKCRLLRLPNPDADFITEAEVFVKQYAGLKLEIRGAKEFHDRFVFADGKLYLFGASIEHAGQRAFSIIPIQDAELVKFIVGYAENVWAGATAIFPRP